MNKEASTSTTGTVIIKDILRLEDLTVNRTTTPPVVERTTEYVISEMTNDMDAPVEDSRRMSDESSMKTDKQSSEEKARSLKLSRGDHRSKCRYTEVC